MKLKLNGKTCGIAQSPQSPRRCPAPKPVILALESGQAGFHGAAVETYVHHLGRDPIGDETPRVALGLAAHPELPRSPWRRRGRTKRGWRRFGDKK